MNNIIAQLAAARKYLTDVARASEDKEELITRIVELDKVTIKYIDHLVKVADAEIE